MTDNEIIHALEYCAYHDMTCRDCPYAGCFTPKFCERELHMDALNLIKRQQAEIERLQDRLEENQATSDKTSEWISASQPPKEYRDEYGELIPFLVCEFGTEYPYRAMYDGKNWGDGISKIPVTYWMPLPEPPKGE